MEYLSVKEVAELKGCSIQYINRIAKNGKAELLQPPQEIRGQPFRSETI